MNVATGELRVLEDDALAAREQVAAPASPATVGKGCSHLIDGCYHAEHGSCVFDASAPVDETTREHRKPLPLSTVSADLQPGAPAFLSRYWWHPCPLMDSVKIRALSPSPTMQRGFPLLRQRARSVAARL